MHVGISLLTLAPGDLGGSETYARQLVRALASSGSHEYTVFAPARARDVADGLRIVEVSDPPVGRRGPSRIPAIALWARTSRELPSSLETLDVLHYALTVPLPKTEAPTVVTLHDVQHRDLPEFFGPARRSFRRIAYDRAARAADAVIVASEFVRERASELLELEPSHLHVVPGAVDHELFHPGDEEREPFLLYPARPWPHKNHQRLFEAFALLRETRPKLRLVLTGGGLERLDPLPDGVERWGLVSPERLASLYRRAACLVFPSLHEGFGLPPLEAMACGCPVAASNAGALPEVCGSAAAILFDGTDSEAIAAAILEADERRDELREQGLTRAAEFTWERTARGHEAVYLAAAEARPSPRPRTARPGVRDARPEDVPLLADLVAQLGYPVSVEAMAQRFERLASSAADRLVVAELDGRVVGFASVHVSLTVEHEEPVAKLSAIAVDRSHRQRGVGEALIAAGEAEARARGCRILYLTTAERRNDAHAFYRRLGFEETGRRFAKWLRD